MVPVLSFTQASVTNDDWFAVTFRQNLKKDDFYHYYVDETGVEYELRHLPSYSDGVYKSSLTDRLSFIQGHDLDGFLKILEYYYRMCMDEYREVKEHGTDVDISEMIRFLKEYKPVVVDNIPHIMI
jgi:hypothetical protein